MKSWNTKPVSSKNWPLWTARRHHRPPNPPALIPNPRRKPNRRNAMNVSKLLAINGNKYPDKEALICGEQRLTYRQWNEAANHLARLLEQRGVQPGDKIVLMMPNVPEFAILYFAIIRAGGIVVPINPRFSHDEAAYILD